MTALAMSLLLVSALFHATWNLLAKQAQRTGGGPAFVWLSALCASLLYTPVGLYVALTTRPGLAFGREPMVAILGSGFLHLIYYLALQKGYSVGDLSLVYPVARGTAPLLATTGAITLFGERPSITALLGAVLVSISIFLLADSRKKGSDSSSSRLAVQYGLLVALFIATYTLWDKHAVSAWLVPPILLDWGANVVRTVLMVPYVASRWSLVVREWRENGRRALLVGLFGPLAYILVLQALSFTPASYIAPAREVSILVGAIMGTVLLKESGTWKRLVGACTMVIALAALALG
jgi:EamA-like transporter family.